MDTVPGRFQNIRVYCKSIYRTVRHNPDILAFHRACIYSLLGDRAIWIRHVRQLSSKSYPVNQTHFSGIAGGVVSQPYFQQHFGLVKDDNSVDQKKLDAVSSNVVSVLQAGAFFGALASAPLSGL